MSSLVEKGARVAGISSRDVATTAGRLAVSYVWRRTCFGLFSLAMGSVGFSYIWRSAMLYKNRRLHRYYGQEASRARDALREALADEEWTDEDEELVDLTVEELLEKLRSKEISSVRVVRVYMRKALECSARANINCVTQPIPGALEHAARCDELLESGQTASLLHGLPVSIKECVNVAGTRSHWGVASQCGDIIAEDCVLIQVLKSHGAVPFVKTNVPQTMFSFECSNPVYGATLNPHDPSRGPGGSSGGEAALMSLGGSLLGIGTDIAGSTRIPAAFSGVVGFKPTMGRISGKGNGSPVPGIVGVARTHGPQAQHVAGCRLLMQALCCELAWRLDPTLPPVPFLAEQCTQRRTLRIGYYDDDGFFPTTPAYKRAVQEARTALESRGHELVAFQPPNVQRAIELYYSLVGADGGAVLRKALRHDVLDVSMRYLVRLAGFSRVLLNLLRPVIRFLWPRSGHSLCQVYPRQAEQLWSLLAERQTYLSTFSEAWRLKQLDGIICPAHAMGPPPLGKCAEMTCSFSYTMLFNLLDYPAGIVPVTKVTTLDELALRDHPQNNYWDSLVAKLSVGTSGLPVAVQCATMPWQDETCLYLMQELETAIAANTTSTTAAATSKA